ncbi:tail protein X [Aureimonas sp. SK2]|uniref:tail protein X n=1 Tax=Aureimonas sp. SK2 TaxID=3015992 RepID=UPI002444E54A|nr:tail protein X [Aureimonas sp. SK2]
MGRRIAVVGPKGDRLDRIARTAYGAETGGTVEALLEANPSFAAMPAEIPAGTRMIVPETVTAEAAETVRPWI